MKSGESPVFSEFHHHQPGASVNLQLQTPVPRRSAAVKRKLKIAIRDVVYPVGDNAYQLNSLFKFPSRKQARLWDSIAHKQEARPDLHFINHYKSDSSGDTEPITIPANSIVLVHPTLRFENFYPQYLFIPYKAAGGSELKFSRVQLQRKPTDPANLQVQVSLDAQDLWYAHSTEETFNSPQPNQIVYKQEGSEIKGEPVHKDSDYLLSAAFQSPKYQERLSSPALLASYSPVVHQHSAYNLEGVQHTSAAHLPQSPVPSQNFPRLPVPLVQSNTLPTQSGAVQTPRAAYQNGLVVLCGNCGIHSQNLKVCDRCKKPTTTGRIIHSEDKTPRQSPAKQKLGNNEPKDEVVELLSSDENEDSREGIGARTPSGSLMDYQLLSLLSPTQNGKESSTDKVTQETVIKVLSEITGKSDDAEMFAMMPCSYIRIGTYMVSSGDHIIMTTIGEIGIYFELPDYKSGESKKIGLPKHQILTLYVYSDSCVSYLKIHTGPKFANWIRKALSMDEDPNGDCFFCPIDGDESRREFVLMFSDPDETKIAIVKRLYSDILAINDDKDGGILARMRDESGSNSLVRVIWDGVNLMRTVTLPTGSDSDGRNHGLPPRPSVPLKERKLFHYPYLPQEGNAVKDSGITIHNTDIMCLAPEQYLNDQVMDFWMRQIVDQLSPEDKERSYFFNTFFYKRLTTKPKLPQQRKASYSFEFDASLSQAEKRHTRVKSWTKRVDIFNKDFLFVPVNENSHWFLVVICFPGMAVVKKSEKRRGRPSRKLPELDDENKDPDRGDGMTGGADPIPAEPMDTADTSSNEASVSAPQTPNTTSTNTSPIASPCIVVFDSLGPENRCKIYSTLRDYLQIEYNTRKAPATRRFDSTEMPGFQPSAPVQPNGCDCGLYVLQYTEAFFQKPIMNFTGVNRMRLRNWFPPSVVQGKRQQIYDFVVDFVTKNFPENVKYIPERGAVVEAGASYQQPQY